MNDEGAPKGAHETTVTKSATSIRPGTDFPLQGIDRAIRYSDNWQIDGFLRAVAAKPAGAVFLIEDVFVEFGLPIDVPNRAGAWTSVAARRGLIERIGYAKAKKASRGGGVSAVWRRVQ